jgi:radical SAM superfamily enzyme YgiQ (UPF0313 family)
VDWEEGRIARRYEQAEKTDMTGVPAPRFDLLKMRHYAFGSVQFSRGCPFQCEFCDIIVMFGRRPRIKTSRQIITELEALREARLSIVFIVDDNLIGNKRAIKQVLRDVIEWQEANAFPLTFLTEASIDLADDPELMRLIQKPISLWSSSASKARTRGRCARPGSCKIYVAVAAWSTRSIASRTPGWRYGPE